MPTYYVKWDATGAANGTSWENAHTTIAAAITAHNSAGDVIEISGGPDGHVYSEIFNAQYGRAFTIRGSSAAGHNGRVTISGAGGGGTIARIDLQTIEDIDIHGAISGYCVASNNAGTLNRCRLGRLNTSGGNLSKGGAGTLTLNRCTIENSSPSYGNGNVTGGTLKLNNCKLQYNNTLIAVTANIEFNNVAIVGNCIKTNAAVVDFSSTGAGVFNNCIAVGNGHYDQNRNIIRNTGTGVVTYNNCNLLPGQPSSTGVIYGFDGTKNNCVETPPMFTAHRRPGYACIIIDDYESLQYFYDVAAALDPLGVKCAIALSRPHLVNAETWGILRGMVAAGHEVMNHTTNHVSFSATTGITITGPANSTITFVPSVSSTNPNEWGGTLTLSVSGSPVHVIDVAATGSYSTPATVATRINALGLGWSATATTNITGTLFACCAAVSNVVSASATEMNLDIPRFVYSEIGWTKKVIEENLGTECKCFAYPYGTFTETVKTLINSSSSYPAGTNKHILARSLGNANNKSYSPASDIPSGSGLKVGWQVFEAYSTHLSTVAGAGASEVEIMTRVGGWGEALQCIGAIGMTYLHKDTTDGANYYSPQMVGHSVQALLDSGVDVTTPSAIMDHILNSGLYSDADDDGSRWVRTFTDEEDYHLLPTSPCIGAGVDVGLTTDADGAVVPGAVGYDIGPYSYMPGWTLFDGTMPALSLSDTAPGSLLEVQEWTRSNITKRQIDAGSR